MLFDTGYRIKVKASMDQFMEGLKELHVLDLIKKYPELTKPFLFLRGENLLQVYTYFYTIGQCLALVVVVFSRDFEGNG